MKEVPSSRTLASSSMMSRDPDGVNLPEDYSSQLEPSGSHIENGHITSTNFVIDEFRNEGEIPAGFDMRKIIGLPPPPPSGKPPKRRKKKGSKSNGKDDTPLSTKNEIKPEGKTVAKKTIEDFIQDDCVVDDDCVDKSARAPPPSEEFVDGGKNTPQNTGIVPLGELLGDKKMSHDQRQLNSLSCPEPVQLLSLPSDSKVLPGDIRASPIARKKEELGSAKISPHYATIKPDHDRSSDNTVDEAKKTLSSSAKSKKKDQKRTKKRGFLKKLFRGGKNLEDTACDKTMNHASSIVSVPPTATKPIMPGDDSLTKPAILNSSDYDFEVKPVYDRPQPEPTTELSNAFSKETNDASDDSSNDNDQLTKNYDETEIQDFYLDPLDNDNGDPPEHPGRPLLLPTASRQNKIYSKDSSCDESDQIRIETVRSQIAEACSNHERNSSLDSESNSFVEIRNSGFAIDLSKEESDDDADIHHTKVSDTKSSLLVDTNNVLSKDPVGVSPVVRGDTRDNTLNLIDFGDPHGKTPEARDVPRTSSSDPVGASFCYTSKTEESFVEEATFTDDDYDLRTVHGKVSGSKDNETNFDGMIESTRVSKHTAFSLIENISKRPEFVSSGESRFAPQLPINEVGTLKLKSAIVENGPKSLKKVPIDIEKSGFKSASSSPIANKVHLTVSAAASTNARAIAYLHRLQDEPSPRLLWHSKKNSITPPLAENSVALAKIRAFNSKRKQGNIASENKIKSPSPHEYNAAMMKETNYLHHDPSKNFAPYSRFKGRRPRKMNDPKLSPRPFETPASQLQNVAQNTLDLKSVVPSEKLSKSAVERGLKLKTIKGGGRMQPNRSKGMLVDTVQKPLGGNRFIFFPANESEIKDPIQRAGRRLLSKAAVPIQAGIRMYLSRREAMDRVWAIIRIQSYVRRWRCEANLHAKKRSALLVQKVYRSCRVREELKNRNTCAVKIQKIVRGYLIALRAYETMFYVCRAQALARGFLVRTSNTRRAEALQKQRKEFYATTIQSTWRSFSARIAFKKRIMDIIVIQSIVRKRAAIRAAGLIRKSVHSTAIEKFQALWRGYSERNKRQKCIAATKIQASWRGFQAYTDFIFVIVDILIVQRSARQWLATRKTNKLREEKAATVIQCAWRRKLAHMNLLHSLVQIVVVQSIVRRFLAKNKVKKQRDRQKRSASLQRRKVLAATAIQKSWRGFWGFSHYVIVRYEINRIQALVRGKLARNKFNLKIGCAILIQAVARRFLARKLAAKAVIDKTIVAARVLELRERNSAKHIQFWWRIVLDWMKEKKAALVIERFFLHVKKEVDRELRKMEQKRIASKKNRKKLQQKGMKVDKGEDWIKTAGGVSIPQVIKKDTRNQRVPLSRPSQKNLKRKDDFYNTARDLDGRGFESTDLQPPPAVLHLAPSEDFSMVSNITNPSILNQFSKDFKSSNAGQTNSEELYQEVRARSKNEKNRRLSTEDYIKKYGGVKTTPNKSLPKSSSQYFFSDDSKKSGDNRKQRRQSYDGVKLTQRQKRATTPRNESNHFVKPVSFLTETPVTPRSLSGTRNGSTPRNSTSRSRRDKSSSELLPPVTPTRKKSTAILRSVVTSITECSTPTENDKMYIPPRPSLMPRKHSNIHGSGGNAVMIMKTNPDFMDDTTIEEAHEIMLLGDEYGEV